MIRNHLYTVTKDSPFIDKLNALKDIMDCLTEKEAHMFLIHATIKLEELVREYTKRLALDEVM